MHRITWITATAMSHATSMWDGWQTLLLHSYDWTRPVTYHKWKGSYH